MNEHPLANAVRPSACPGLLRIVAALDGGICRIKLAGGVISADQARAVAQAAERYAGGVIEATNRANLQIRGIGAQHQPLIDSLLAAGLGPTAEGSRCGSELVGAPNPASAESDVSRVSGADDVRNLMLSPSAGIDARMLIDTRPLAAQILASLQGQPRFHQLSAKFWRCSNTPMTCGCRPC